MKKTFIIITIFIILFYILICPFVCSKYINIFKLGTKYDLIENPLSDGQNFYQVKKYRYTRIGTFNILGSGSNQDIFKIGLADADKNIIIPINEKHSYSNFYKAHGFTHKNTIDTINIVAMRSNQVSSNTHSIKLVSNALYTTNGEPFNPSKHFKNNTFVFGNYLVKSGFIKPLYIPNSKSMLWYDENIIIVSSRKPTYCSREPTYYGTYLTSGKEIIPENKNSKEDVLEILDFGEWESYFDVEKLKKMVRYENDETGESSTFHANGKLEAIGKIKNDKKEGTWKTYHTNGKLKTIGKYENNERIDEWKVYDKNGKFRKLKNYSKKQ